MPGSSVAEFYFIVAMMILILIFSFAACYFFVRQYRSEMREKRERAAKSEADRESERSAARADGNA